MACHRTEWRNTIKTADVKISSLMKDRKIKIYGNNDTEQEKHLPNLVKSSCRQSPANSLYQ